MNLRIFFFFLFGLIIVSCTFTSNDRLIDESFESVYPNFFLEKYDSIVLVDKESKLRLKKMDFKVVESCVLNSKGYFAKFYPTAELFFYRNGEIIKLIGVGQYIIKYEGSVFRTNCKLI